MDEARVLLLTSWHLSRMRSMPRAFWAVRALDRRTRSQQGCLHVHRWNLAPLVAADHVVAQPRRRRGLARLAVLPGGRRAAARAPGAEARVDLRESSEGSRGE